MFEPGNINNPFADVAPSLAWCSVQFTIEEIDQYVFSRYQIPLPAGYENMVAKRRCEYLAGRICASKALYRAGGSGDIGRAKEGYPIWPKNFIGSISHTQGLAIACVMKNEEASRIGLDMELMIDDRTAQDISSLILVPEDKKFANGMDFNRLVTLVFSIKEALFKALYKDVGYIFGFECAAVIHLDENLASLEIQCDLSERWKKGSVVDVNYRWLGLSVYSLVLQK